MSGERAQEAIELLQRLLRIDTVNPPGNERPAQELLMSHLRDAGLEVALVGEEADRPNLVARLRGAEGPVLGLLSHVDPCSPTRRAGGTARVGARAGLRMGARSARYEEPAAAETWRCARSPAGWRPRAEIWCDLGGGRRGPRHGRQ